MQLWVWTMNYEINSSIHSWVMTTFCTKPQNNLITQKFQFVLRRWDRPSQPQAEPHSLTTGTRKAQPHFPLEASFIRRGGCFFFLLALNRVSAHCSRRLQWIYCRWINSIICIIAPYLFDWTTAELLVVFAQQTTIFHIYFAHTFPPLAVSNEKISAKLYLIGLSCNTRIRCVRTHTTKRRLPPSFAYFFCHNPLAFFSRLWISILFSFSFVFFFMLGLVVLTAVFYVPFIFFIASAQIT